MADEIHTLTPEVEKKIMEVMVRDPKGISQTTLQTALPNIRATSLVGFLNTLIAQGKVNLLQRNSKLVYAWKIDNGSKKFVSSDVEEKVIYEAVKRAGNTGTSARELKFACNMPQPQITKVLKSLEARKIVKCIISTTKKKVFMLYELEANVTVTGGKFYNGDDFDETYVNALVDVCYRFLLQAKGISEKVSDPIIQRRTSFKSSKEICDYVNSLKISKVVLDLVEIEKLLQSLVFDGKVAKDVSLTKGAAPENYYCVTKPLLPNVGLMRMPCGVCLVYQECGKGRAVSPATCEYMKEWLEF